MEKLLSHADYPAIIHANSFNSQYTKMLGKRCDREKLINMSIALWK